MLWLVSAPVEAYQGVELGRDCRSADEADRARCEGFITGFMAGARMDIEGEPLNMWRSYGYTWCGPSVFEVDVMVEALFEGARTGKTAAHFPAPVMLAQSLAAKFTCSDSSSGQYQRLTPSLVQDE